MYKILYELSVVWSPEFWVSNSDNQLCVAALSLKMLLVGERQTKFSVQPRSRSLSFVLGPSEPDLGPGPELDNNWVKQLKIEATSTSKVLVSCSDSGFNGLQVFKLWMCNIFIFHFFNMYNNSIFNFLCVLTYIYVINPIEKGGYN